MLYHINIRYLFINHSGSLLIHSLIHPSFQPLIYYLFIQPCLIHLFNQSITFLHSFTHSFIQPVYHVSSFLHSFIYSTSLSLHSFTQSFIQAVYLFIPSLSHLFDLQFSSSSTIFIFSNQPFSTSLSIHPFTHPISIRETIVCFISQPFHLITLQPTLRFINTFTLPSSTQQSYSSIYTATSPSHQGAMLNIRYQLLVPCIHSQMSQV